MKRNHPIVQMWAAYTIFITVVNILWMRILLWTVILGAAMIGIYGGVGLVSFIGQTLPDLLAYETMD